MSDFGPDEDRILSRHEDVDKVRALASDLGLRVQASDLVPPGTAYILRPSGPCWDDPEWVREFLGGRGS